MKIKKETRYTKDRNERLEKARQYVKDNVWKQFFKQKVYELGIIPLSGLALWKVPTWIGWGIVKLFNLTTSSGLVCNKIVNGTIMDNFSGAMVDNRICDGVNYNNGAVWFIGLIILVVLFFFAAINWYCAKETVVEKARYKFSKEDSSSYDDKDLERDYIKDGEIKYED